MKYLLALILLPSIIFAQDFEQYELPLDTFLNGSDGNGGFESPNSLIQYPNSYDPMWDSWSGWSISTMTDTLTRGFENQYSCISGGGAEGSTHYATTFVLGQTDIIAVPYEYGGSGELVTASLSRLFINNSTYAYYSMLEGDAFAKKFGGADGTDPDYFYVSIKSSSMPGDSVIFYLADFRSDDPAEDYIIKDWTVVDIPEYGDTISMSLYSSDVGAFGMNTPAYFCIDSPDFMYLVNNVELDEAHLEIYPNPSSGLFYLDDPESTISYFSVYNSSGQKVIQDSYNGTTIDLSDQSAGSYLLYATKKNGKKITKRLMLK